ncbi:enoyl-CoA hydratase/isomerase domain-containing protein [Sarocladium implicatum]|nr:enoyl-CoA hydratase/isomerase domain-containing protein [Sarocladium implicatum]
MESLPSSYESISLPSLKLLHHPPSSPSVTPIITILLHRPSARNGFTDTMVSSLATAYDLLSRDSRVRCIILSSSDPSNRIFCAGMDFNEKHDFGPTVTTHRDGGGKVTLAMTRCTKPIVAAINGSAVGVGITMTLPANIRVVSKDAKIGFVFSQRGFNMEACSSFYLPRLIGTSRALHLTTTGAVYPATSPLFSSLFSEIVPADQVYSTAVSIAEQIASNVSPVAAHVMKEMMYRGPESPEEAHLLESKLFFDLYSGPDAKEGVDSFMGKRRPEFTATMEKDAPTFYPWWKPVDVKAKI